MKPLATLLCAVTLAAAAEPVATPFEEAREALRTLGPPELRGADEAAFAAWLREHDAAIRGRLAQGEIDSLINLWLYGTSFTSQPRLSVDQLGEQARAGLLRARLDDLLRGLAAPRGNPRLEFLAGMLRASGHDPADAATGVFLLEQLQRVLRERIEINARIAEQDSAVSAFSARGVSLDATIFPNFAIEAALTDLRERGLLRVGATARVAVVGPGLDFVDKEAGFDYYPEQTLQPFAVQDSLRRLGLAEAPRVTVLDISPRVLAHLASLPRPYTIQLPRDSRAAWTEAALAYWRRFGSALGREAEPISPPLPEIATRAVELDPAGIEAADLNIITGRLPEQFDLIVVTNLLVYYSPFELALAASNLAAMLRPGGYLLTNDLLPEASAGPLQPAGSISVTYRTSPQVMDNVYWYRR